jgi:GH15 family glucan-1,4-alpha-glucosidase
MKIGFTEEAGHFMEWLSKRCRELDETGTLQIMYDIGGQPMGAERVLEHLSGYKGSRPVRIGNGAVQQLQLDIYGELMDSVYLYDKYGTPISDDLWQHLRRLTSRGYPRSARRWSRSASRIWWRAGCAVPTMGRSCRSGSARIPRAGSTGRRAWSPAASSSATAG